jgi:hypothetical protein
MRKQLLLLSFLFFSCTGIAFFLIRPNPQKQAERALSFLKQGNATAAEAALTTSLPPVQRLLLKSYIEQARGRFSQAEQLLQTAYQEAKKGSQVELQFEILMAKASNAYFERREPDFAACIDSAWKLSMQATVVRESELIFFEGLHAYMMQNYAEALRLWSGLGFLEKGSWQLERLFPTVWRKMHLAHCLIETNEIPKGREILEKESHHASSSPECGELVPLLLGLSYLKEAAKVPLDQRQSTYTMARFYFEHARPGKTFSQEKRRVGQHLEEEANRLLLVDQEKNCWGLECVHRLQEWDEQEALIRLAGNVAKKMAVHYSKEPSSLALCKAVRKDFQDTAFHSYLSKQMLDALSLALKKGESSDFFALWELVEALSLKPKTAAKEVASLTAEEIFETIKKDNLQLTRTLNYLAFWEKLDRSQEERELLARDLLYQSKLFWHNEKQEKKGVKLMELALRLSHHHALIEKEIAAFLTTLYRHAENSNMIRRLTLIYEAMEHFNISRQELITKATLANHVADAEYLYSVHNFPAAKLHAGWVMKLDPENEAARRLAGLCSYRLGEYNKALNYLKGLKAPDEEARKALMLSQALFAQERAKQICQSELSDAFEE